MTISFAVIINDIALTKILYIRVIVWAVANVAEIQ